MLNIFQTIIIIIEIQIQFRIEPFLPVLQQLEKRITVYETFYNKFFILTNIFE